VALTLDGEPVWQRDLGKEYTPFDVRWGHGSSPAIYKDRLFLLVDHPLDSYLLAVDRRTGKDILKVSRGKERRSYTTPFIVSRDEGDQLIVNTNEAIQALDPGTGRLIWQVGEDNRVPIGVPVFHSGVLYSNRGYNSSPYLAVGVDGAGDVSGSKLKWRVPTGGPYVSSLTYYQGVLYMANERGIASAVDAETGETFWKQRLGGVFSASPVAADGRIYLVEESGRTYVVEAGREFKLVATNDLGERTLASPAISGGLIFLRTDNRLFAIGN
jgi:outer membrane protein assembly factor BamB